ncbi:glycoside hydrolase family 108 protein [Chelativorans sp. YIM 93263]|uniref:glycoside hydrolase family 108 protein n=1 Tax=Chelativorans sp. YIM 93263 TaxID=2906648 RepID=UPI002379BA8E|nr:glycosyl hydrolase 108 family protein [Chelativorans sp. YIM 93263]
MSTAKFRRCHDVTKAWEGGWSDHPADPGGKTMYGVTEAVYHAWLRQHGKPVRLVRQITIAEAEQIYFEQYWVPSGGPTLGTGVDLAIYDASVNCGVSRGRKWLLASIGGPDHETVKRICAIRLSFMRSLNIWNTFGRGWARRVADIEAKGVAWALTAANDNSDRVKQQLGGEADKARSQARKQTGAAAGAGGGGAISLDQGAQLGDWLLVGIASVAFAALAFLIIRAVINTHRATAYAREAANA